HLFKGGGVWGKAPRSETGAAVQKIQERKPHAPARAIGLRSGPFTQITKGHPSQKLGCPFFVSAIYPEHCLQAAPGMTMSLAFLSRCAGLRSWSSAPHLANFLKKV